CLRLSLAVGLPAADAGLRRRPLSRHPVLAGGFRRPIERKAGVRDILRFLWETLTRMNDLPQWASSANVLPALFVGTFFFGDTVTFAGILLAATGALSPAALFALSLLGTIGSDLARLFCVKRLVDLARR